MQYGIKIVQMMVKISRTLKQWLIMIVHDDLQSSGIINMSGKCWVFFLNLKRIRTKIGYKFSKCAYEILIKMLFILYLVSFGIRQGSRVQPKAKSINRFFFISRT